MPIAFIVFMVLFGLGIATLAVVLARRQARQVVANVRGLAEAFRIAFVEAPGEHEFLRDPPEARGAWRGRLLRIHTFATGSGKSRQHWCRVELEGGFPAGLEFLLSGENLFTKLVSAAGWKDLSLGDERFDRTFRVKAAQPEIARLALVPELRERLLAARDAGASGEWRTEEGRLLYTEQGFFSDPARVERFKKLPELAAELATALEVAAGR